MKAFSEDNVVRRRSSIFLVFSVFSIKVGAATSPLPALILCTPYEHHRPGIETHDLPGSEAHLFEYGGKVIITQKEN